MLRVINPEHLLERLGIRFQAKGNQLWANCPNPDHRERTPSWRMIVEPGNPKNNSHRCYGCGFGGWPVHLVETVLKCSREDARAWLRDIEADPPIPFELGVEHKTLPRKFVLPPGVVFAPFDQWPKVPREYLERDRKVPAWQVVRWGLAYTAPEWDKETNPLSGRIVFPVRDNTGKLLYYTGRTYLDSKRRYKEPSKAEGANLGAVFGEQHWRAGRGLVVVTEGALDALAVERACRCQVGGLFGSQLMQGHLTRLSTFHRVLIASDPDNAGNKVVRELEGYLRRTAKVERVEIPEGEDCASLDTKVLALRIEQAAQRVLRAG